MSRFTLLVYVAAALTAVSCLVPQGNVPAQSMPTAAAAETFPIGYSDTPKLPMVDWRVHDVDRPRPEIVPTGTSEHAPPKDAVVLFDGTNLDQWVGSEGQPAAWKVENGYLEVTNTGDIHTKRTFGSVQLHVEWRAPVPAQLSSQKRGNSGVFLADRYEVQVLDSFNNVTYADGQAGAIYGQFPPLVNVARPPGEWQTYDIVFMNPKFDGDKLVKPAIMTVLHNGVLIQNHVELIGATAHKEVAHYEPHGPAPLRLQDHGDKQQVRFRNIWVRELPDN